MALRFIVSQTPVPVVPGDKDDSSYDHVFTQVGESPPKYNENSKIGTAALRFSGNDQKLTSPASADWNLGTTFTIDFWMRFHPFYVQQLGTNGGAKIISNHEGGGEVQEQGYELGLTSTGELTATYWGDTGKGVTGLTITSSGQSDIVTNGGWHHVCWQRSTEGENIVQRLFLDGVSVANGSTSTYIHNTVTSTPFTIGARARSDATIELPFLYGTLDELEIIDGVAKFSTGGFTPPTTANTSTANHLLLMHFDSSNPEATIWYDNTDNLHWFTLSGNWTGSAWTSFSSTWTAQYAWNQKFRPEKIRITGTPVGGGTITVENSAEDFTIASGAASTTVTMNTTFESEDETADDIHYLKNMTQFSQITKIECDAKSVVPSPA